MGDFIEESEFSRLLALGLPLLDVRSPVEVEQSSVPNGINIPILTNDERAAVGLEYKKRGQAAAVELGHQLVSEEKRRQRVAHWSQTARARECAGLFCARGGMRSEIAAAWLREAGIDLPRVRGGHKALRRYLLEVLDTESHTLPAIVVTGETGAGKTDWLRSINPGAVLDLERIARHRGSAFGRIGKGQPGVATFENTIACQILAFRYHGVAAVLVEDESRTIGALSVPEALFRRMQNAPMILLRATLEERVARLRKEYIEDLLATDSSETAAKERLWQTYREALKRIRSALGGARYTECLALLDSAFLDQTPIEAHDAWIQYLLMNYYDPYYRRHIEQNANRIILKGTMAELREALEGGLLCRFAEA